MKHEFLWAIDGPNKLAHFCVVNRDNPDRIRTAAVCGYGYPGMGEYKPAPNDADPCPLCLKIERSGAEIRFVIPGTGEKIVVREGRRR